MPEPDRHRAPSWTSGLAEPLSWGTRQRHALQTVLDGTGNIAAPEAVSHSGRAFSEFEDMDGGLHGSKIKRHLSVFLRERYGALVIPRFVDQAVEGSK